MPHKDPDAKRVYMREYLRKRREDPEFRRIANKRTIASRQTPEGKRKHAESNKRYKEHHPERVKEQMHRVDQLSHRIASRKERQGKWLASLDIETRRAVQRAWRINRQAKKAENGGKCTIRQWAWRADLYGNCCAYCHSPLEKRAEIDHVIPVARGGSGWPSNLVPACRSCNAHKNTSRWIPRIPRPKGIIPE